MRAAITFAIVYLIVLGFVWTKTSSPTESSNLTPDFEVGDCIRFDRKLDEWGIQRIWIDRVLKVGKRSYLVANIDYAMRCQDGDKDFCSVIEFKEQHYYLKTSCNP